MAIDVFNPATGKLLNSYPEMSQSEVSNILESMHLVRKEWEKTSFDHRAKLMHRLADIYEERKHELGMVITQEMGKPITQAEAEIVKCAWLMRHYADNTEGYLEPVHIETEHSKSYVMYEPLGIIFAIMPWNFPFWQVLRFAVPNLMNGNAGVLSHAPNSTGAALKMEELFVEAGFPEDLFRSLVIDVDLSSYVIDHPHVMGVTLTGSNRAGAAVGSAAGKAQKKAVLELGGSDPYVILEDADLDQAATDCAVSRLGNAGQVCIAAKRIIVVDEVREAFVEKLKTAISGYVCGDPEDPKTTMGPLAREDLFKLFADQIERSKAEGVEIAMGGEPSADCGGYYYPVTLMLDVQKGTVPYDEELFGPAVCVLYARDEAHALEIANDTQFGLGACVYTQDLERGERIAREELHAGACNLNRPVGSDPRLPFGGIKMSGYGRELADSGSKEFMNQKTIVIR